jgi:hypothetical protein
MGTSSNKTASGQIPGGLDIRGADGGIRTPDLLITSELLYP